MFRLAEKDLAHVEKAESSIESIENPTREALKQLESIRRQKRNKVYRLICFSILQRITFSDSNEESASN